MKKNEKKKLLELIKSMKSAHKEAEKTRSIEIRKEILANCQEAAIEIGMFLEKDSDSHKNIVEILEQYCEFLYQISILDKYENLSDEFRKVEELLFKVEKCIVGISCRYEFLFLPYKASMWDSLESVWRAAKENSNVDTYVMPIPYFDKLPDKSFGEMHYEIEAFPKEISLTHYGEYDIEARKPDAVFIHNPYDQFNLVTSVPEECYLSIIKKHTEMLVYIPYFLARNDKVAEEYCVLPGTIHANRVIVQSEKVRDIYIQSYKEAMERSGICVLKEELNKKFLSLGSPKLDKIYSDLKKEAEVPEEWENIINNRKVVFYNTHLRSVMQEGGELFLEKLKKVLATFKKKKEIALLWRPHPLVLSTIKAMNPDLLIYYEKIVEEYKEGNWGIYDDTADFNRAVRISHAYYGDYGSVVELFKKSGKPVLIQNKIV